jgi:hypothetical protein
MIPKERDIRMGRINKDSSDEKQKENTISKALVTEKSDFGVHRHR